MSTADKLVTIASESLTAKINPFGAELVSLKDADGRELMTDADPAFWTGHAPLLFPIVGELAGGRYRYDGRDHALPRHGFARKLLFDTVIEAPDHAFFRLTESAEHTLSAFPFFFNLYIEYRLEGATLVMAVVLVNRTDRDMPASFGFHPAFAWPLPYGRPREAHTIRFAQDEPATLKQLQDGLIAAEDRPSPVEGNRLALGDALFEDDALIWEGLASRSLVYGADTGPSLRIEWDKTPNLGIWTKPGAHFLCIEPWAGIADRANFSGEIWDKPGIVRIPSTESVDWTMRVTLQNA
jgi:galactose mutarotase-like enzyme